MKKQETEESSKLFKERKTYYDFMRICAAFLVIFNHLPGYVLFTQFQGDIKTWGYMIITMFTKINVPIFFMISGALLLNRDEEIGEIFRKRISRMAILLIIFSALFFFVQELPSIQFDWKVFVIKLLSEKITGEYWFLYAYIGFLIMLPYLRRMVRGFTERDFIYIVIIHFFMCTVCPIVNYILMACGKESITAIGYFKTPLMVEKMIFYPVIGYYLDHIADIHSIKKKQMLLLAFMTIVGIFWESVITIHQGVTTGTWTEIYVNLFDYVIAITFFVIIKYLFECKGFLREKKLRGKYVH